LLSVKKQGDILTSLQAIPAVVHLAWRIAREAAQYEVLYANSQKSLIVAALAGALSRRPVIWNLHDILTADHFSALNRRLSVFCANYLTHTVIVNSHATLKGFTDSGGAIDQTTVVYNGIDAAPFNDAADADVAALRTALDLPLDLPLVGVFSRLAPWKGQHLLIQALEHLPNAHAVFVGDSLFDGDDAYEQHLHQLARRLDLLDRVHFLGFRQDIPQLMHLVDIVAHTSVAPEPFGRVAVEGQLARRPVVAARAGGILEIIDHEETGLLFSPGDEQGLASALTRLIQDPDLAEQLAQRGYHKASTQFTIDKMQRDIVRHLERIAPHHEAQESEI
jgi:glycosyltransferase involved in cell wall biosynthesis